jgi:hypothetical protein
MFGLVIGFIEHLQNLTTSNYSSSSAFNPKLIHSERTLVHKQPQDPWRSTNEHSAQWNKKVEYEMFKKIRKSH